MTETFAPKAIWCLRGVNTRSFIMETRDSFESASLEIPELDAAYGERHEIVRGVALPRTPSPELVERMAKAIDPGAWDDLVAKRDTSFDPQEVQANVRAKLRDRARAAYAAIVDGAP